MPKRSCKKVDVHSFIGAKSNLVPSKLIVTAVVSSSNCANRIGLFGIDQIGGAEALRKCELVCAYMDEVFR